MGSKILTGLAVAFAIAIGITACSSNETATSQIDSNDTITLSTRFPLSRSGQLIVEQKGDTLIHYYPGQIIKQPLKSDSVLVMIWDGKFRYRFLLNQSFEAPGLNNKIKQYLIDGEIDGVDYWMDGYGLVASNPFGYPDFYDHGNRQAEMAIKALINDTTGFFTMLLPEEDTVNIAKIDSIRRKSK